MRAVPSTSTRGSALSSHRGSHQALSPRRASGSLTPRRTVLILWGVLTGATAVPLMLAGGLTALQNTVIVASLPFLVIIAGLTVAFWKELDTERKEQLRAADL